MVLIIAGPGVQTALRLITWPFRSEMRLFLILSIFSLFVCIVELILYPDLNNDDLVDQQTDELVSTMNNATSNDAGFTSSMLEVKSIFIPCVFSLFSVIFIIGKLVQFVFFGTLSEIERSNLSRLLFRFIVFRVIILSGAINVSRLSSVFGWLVWFGALGLLHAITLTATSRCNQLAASSLVSRREWFRLSCVLAFLLIGNWFLIRGGLYHCLVLADINVVDTVGEGVVHGRSLTSSFKTPTALGVLKSKLTGRRELIYDAVDVVAYILAESILLFCLIMHLLGSFLIHAYDRWELARGRSWLQLTTFTYYLDFIRVLVYRFIEIAHYLHLLLWSRIFSVASLIVFLHIRFAYSILANRIRQHVAHRRLLRYIAEHFELRTFKPATKQSDGSKNATESDSNTAPGNNDGSEDSALQACAICWEPMHIWRQLPCRHEFHESCLRSWLEQNPTCPTCRRDLGIPTTLLTANRNPGIALDHDQAAMGLLLHNLVRNPEGLLHQPPQGGTQATTTGFRAGRPTQAGHERPTPTTGGTRNLFATAVGLNLGMSIGSAPMVAAAAQAAAWDAAAPGTSHSPPTTSTSDQEPSGSGALQPSDSSVQQSPVTRAATTVEDNQVRRHSFHFDGSRYFSWLPSLHVELSDVIREVFAAGAEQFTQVVDDITPRPTGHMLPLPNEPVPLTEDLSTTATTSVDAFHPDQYELIRLPAGLRQPAREISRMFPQFPLSIIVADLLRTGVAEVTVENLITRPPPPIPRSTSPSRLSVHGTTTSDTVVRPRLTATTTDQEANSTVPPSVPSFSRASVSTSEPTDISTEPETILAHRRRQMIDQARERFFSRNQS